MPEVVVSGVTISLLAPWLTLTSMGRWSSGRDQSGYPVGFPLRMSAGQLHPPLLDQKNLLSVSEGILDLGTCHS